MNLSFKISLQKY